MSLQDQREDGLRRHGRFSCLTVCPSQISKDRAEGSFVSAAGVLVAEMASECSILSSSTHMSICTRKELLVDPVHADRR